MSFVETLYTAALRGGRVAVPLLSRGGGKLARGLRGRAGLLERMAAWTRAERDPSRPLVWFHAPSVGEGLQARAVMEAFRARNPAAQIAFTFFSPSAEALALRMPADFADYLPLDLPREVGRALELLAPRVLAFSKTDLWPNLTRAAAARGVRMALVSATLPAESSRVSGPARTLLAPAYRRLDRIGAISAQDASRFAAFGVPADRLEVMGDAHFDRVLARADGVDRDSKLLASLRPPPHRAVVVAGSTWAPDEARLISIVQRADPRPALIVVPHEPTAEHLLETGSILRAAGLPVRLLSTLAGRWDPAEVLVVDRVGVLGDLYALADLAYVGGGWGTAGLHSVLEPAAFGIPVVFGPNHANAREAAELVARGGAFSAKEEMELRRTIERLLGDRNARAAAGTAARAYVEEGRGAAERGASLIERLLAADSHP